MKESDKSYKNFEVIDVCKVPDCNSTAFYLKDKKSGLEVLHLYNDDKENLCAFAFRTPVENSTGVPHIIEHSVLCGSEKYPLKDPFIRLENQSVKTYLNAMTFPDKTVYPIASIVEKDYFNLAKVYADAVFFPRLTKLTFMQEGHRVEKNDEGKYEIAGVVYNEMKGAYSDFDSWCCDAVNNTILKDTIYDKDSGGDPLEIPSLTYEQFKAFHEKYYKPNNCLVFLYGNIPTEKQLDFLQENILDRLPEAKNEKSCALEVFENIKLQPLEPGLVVRKRGPNSINDEEQKSNVLLSFRTHDAYDSDATLQLSMIMGILMDNDGSPLKKALLQSNLGNDLSIACGFNGAVLKNAVTLGLQGVKKGDEDKVPELIEEEIRRVAENPIDKSYIDAVLMTMEVNLKEIKRYSGPYSLVIMRQALRGWTYGKDPVSPMLARNRFEKLKEKIDADPSYLNQLLKKYFVDNKDKAVIIVTPDSAVTKEREEKEQAIIDSIVASRGKKEIDAENKELRKYQQSNEDDKASCLPYITPQELDVEVDDIDTKVQWMNYDGEKRIPFMYNIEGTNGINYIRVAFPCDVLEPEDYRYLPLFTEIFPELGFGGMKWDQAAVEVSKIIPRLGASEICSVMYDTPNTKKIYEQVKEYNYAGRDWVVFQIKVLEENTAQALDVFYKLLTSYDTSDIERIRSLLDEEVSDVESQIVSEGLSLIAGRLNSRKSKHKALNEIWRGLSQVFFIREINGKPELLAKKITEIAEKLFKAGAIVHVTCDKESFENAQKAVKDFCVKFDPGELKNPNPRCTQENFVKLTALGDNPLTDDQIYEKEMQIGYAAVSTYCSDQQSKEGAAEDVFTHWFTNNTVWERMRTICGAYGAYASVDDDKNMGMMTYRDPNPFASIDELWKCLEIAAKKKFSLEDTQKVVTGTYSEYLQPKTPSAKGSRGFLRTLFCFSQEDRLERINMLLNVKPKDLEEAARRLYKNSREKANFAVLVPVGSKPLKSQKNALKIPRIQL
ncbi:MAG: insulinase family protein [Treponema sp.]|nr:insulinase family protein [Treponema sp.]